MSESKEFVNIIKSITKKTIRKGENTRKLTDGSTCRVHFKDVSQGCNNSLHLSSSSATIIIGVGCEMVDRAVEYCLQTMTKLEESCFEVAACNLEFTATLVDCSFKPYSFEMTDNEKMSMAIAFKDQGVVLFKRLRLPEAFQKFRKALQYALTLNYTPAGADDDESASAPIHGQIDFDQVQMFLTNLYNNMAACQLQYMNYDSVIPLCEKSLAVAPNAKAYYRRATVYIAKEEYEKAEQNLLELLNLERENSAARQKLNFVQEKLKPGREKYKQTIKKMFS